MTLLRLAQNSRNPRSRLALRVLRVLRESRRSTAMRSGKQLPFAFACSIGLLSLALVAATQDRFPDGPGKAQLLKVCSGCHDAEIVLANLQTPAEWADTLQSMAQQGAEAMPDEWRLIERYIDTNLALIPINKAAADELALTMDVTPDVAAAIVQYRQNKGPFKTTDDVKKVAGIDAAKVDARKGRFIF